MADIKRVGDSGIHTVEGNLAGRRAAELTKEREKQREEYEVVKQKIKDQNATGALRISDKFSAETMTQKSFQVGFIDESVAKSQLEAERAAESKVLEEKKKKERAEKRKKSTLALSFNPEGEEDEDLSAAIEAPVVKRICKDPTVATSFLPDRQRDAAIEAEKERLKEEWLKQQEVIKNEFLEVVYSYWDGTGHRKEIRIRKGTTIGRFLEIVKKQISGEFKEILCVSSDSLMYVKEDLIIPHHYSFYDLIVTKARGKSGKQRIHLCTNSNVLILITITCPTSCVSIHRTLVSLRCAR